MQSRLPLASPKQRRAHAVTDGCHGLAPGAIEHVRANVAFLQAYLAEHVPGVTAMPLEATYCVWLDCRGLGLAAADVNARLQRAGLVLSAGSTFDPSGASDHFQRINVACPRSVLVEAALRLKRALAVRVGHELKT